MLYLECILKVELLCSQSCFFFGGIIPEIENSVSALCWLHLSLGPDYLIKILDRTGVLLFQVEPRFASTSVVAMNHSLLHPESTFSVFTHSSSKSHFPRMLVSILYQKMPRDLNFNRNMTFLFLTCLKLH